MPTGTPSSTTNRAVIFRSFIIRSAVAASRSGSTVSSRAAAGPRRIRQRLHDLPDADDDRPAHIDTAKLRQATDAAFANPAGLTAAFAVVYDGRIIAERYANGAHADMQLESWSMGKTITGTLIGLLVEEGALGLWDPAPVPAWRRPGDPRGAIRVAEKAEGAWREAWPSTLTSTPRSCGSCGRCWRSPMLAGGGGTGFRNPSVQSQVPA